MKTYYLLFWLSFILILTSCRKEEIEFVEAPNDDTLTPSSRVTNTMSRVAMNDGSNDNIIDNANCISIQLPVTVIVNEITVTVNTESDYDTIEAILDDSLSNDDTLEIIFPINITLPDYSTVTVNTQAELNNYAANCNGENEVDDDIECIDFQYPLGVSVFNTSNELIYTVEFTNDYEMYTFLSTLSTDVVAQLEFPITLILTNDSTTITANTLTELENTILNYIDDCDEDDDYDYNDDDCIGCSPSYVTTILTGCSDWTVDKLERNGNDYDDLYSGYTFNFFSDNTLSASYSGNTYNGSWSTVDNNGTITISIDIPSLPYCNNDWILYEVDSPPGETKIDLRVGEDRIRYENYCN
ncbi:hypothetical protein [Mangrovimonas spongiae]|uniref:Uncharacterized protein n=1 Tax=Mangrovimonas spongiae TaxID=2494697 RepID=A0A428JZX4_9FLAO|nr:hypothetical protein [Mangrovimonas spongiae]RSK39705.1 hypothetical protein EJA19_07410 [Mangrovimonas spongiae]